MTSQTAIHQRNLESSILFVQQEHASTLKALHEEIHNLQKKCSDLTFQLTMQGYGLEDEGAEKLKSLESEVNSQKEEKIKIQNEMEVKEKKIKALESEIHSQKRKYLGELRSQTQIINNLKAELEAKSNNIAYLTSELHRIKVREKDLDVGADSTIRRTQVPTYMPTPPKDMNTKLRRPHRRRANVDELQNRPVRVTSGKSSGSSRSASPDITPFIARDQPQPFVDKRQQTSILPPIAKTVTQDGNAVLVHQVVASQQLTRRKADSNSPEITTLAVDQVSRSDPKWIQTHGSKFK